MQSGGISWALAATGAGVSLLPTETKPNGARAKAGPLEEGVIAGGDGDVAKVAAEFMESRSKGPAHPGLIVTRIATPGVARQIQSQGAGYRRALRV